MRSAPWRAVSLVLILGLVLMSCDGPNRGSNTQPSSAQGFLIVVTASPNVVRGATAGGEDTGGCAQIQVKVFDTHGNLIDGAFVSGTSSLGVFRLGTEDLLNFVGVTTRGFLTRTWCAKAERGTAIITATVEDAVATVLITIF